MLINRYGLLVLCLMLAACASPRYQTVHRYEAPTDANARACLQACEPKLATCQTTCQQRYQACLVEIEPAVDARHHEAMQRYERELAHYRLEQQTYELQVRLNWNYYSIWHHPWHYGHPWYTPYYTPPIPPHKPTREEAFKQVRQTRCESDCGCQPIYDACFLGCGGKLIPEVKCIAHCPKQ